MLLSLLVFLSGISSALAVNFDWENVQLTQAETANYSAIRFAGQGADPPEAECRYTPADKAWPSVSEWTKFNETLGGALLKPLPLASVCYEGPNYNAVRCGQLKNSWTSMNIHTNDPISVMSQWSTGSSCVATSDPKSTCSQGGYPVYVVNATTARHVQLAVNFARNQNIRLVVKNSGHDFNGRSVGGASLSIWVHNMKGLNYHANYTASSYSGQAVAYGGGFQAQDAYTPQSRYNITFLVAGGPGVGIAGGFLQGAGHSTFTSYYGLAADHVLSIQVVTASGEFKTLDAKQNPDLFWAIRGGGGGNWGIITSVVVKAFPNTPVTSGSITFGTLPRAGSNSTGVSEDNFWEGMRAYWETAVDIVDAGGLGYNFIRHTKSGNATGLEFTVSISLPNRLVSEYRNITRPLLTKLQSLGFPVTIPKAKRYYISSAESHRSAILDALSPRHLKPRAIGDVTGNTLIASRLWPRANFETPEALDEMNAAIRDAISTSGGGYTFHGMNYGPSLEVSGHPDNAVNPAFRNTLMHAQGYEADAWWDTTSPVVPFPTFKQRHDRLQSYMQKWRDITPGGGSYINEGDAQSPVWQAEFWGNKYGRLVGIKRKWDPWGVFFSVSTPGSEAWEVRGSSGGGYDGIYTQDGQLCRTG